MSERIKQLFLVEDTESQFPRCYISAVRPPEDSPQKLVAILEIKILRGGYLDYSPELVWKALIGMEK